MNKSFRVNHQTKIKNLVKGKISKKNTVGEIKEKRVSKNYPRNKTQRTNKVKLKKNKKLSKTRKEKKQIGGSWFSFPNRNKNIEIPVDLNSYYRLPDNFFGQESSNIVIVNKLLTLHTKSKTDADNKNCDQIKTKQDSVPDEHQLIIIKDRFKNVCGKSLNINIGPPPQIYQYFNVHVISRDRQGVPDKYCLLLSNKEPEHKIPTFNVSLNVTNKSLDIHPVTQQEPQEILQYRIKYIIFSKEQLTTNEINLSLVENKTI